MEDAVQRLVRSTRQLMEYMEKESVRDALEALDSH